MVKHAPLEGPKMAPDALDLVKGLLPEGIAGVSAYLSERLSRQNLFSTIFDGTLTEDVPDELRADLDILTKALGESVVRRDALARHTASHEPQLMTLIRQLEGRPPRLPAALRPVDTENAQSLLVEARAVGFDIPPHDQPIGLLPPYDCRVLDRQDGRVEFGAGTSWTDLKTLSASAGLSTAPLEVARFNKPVDAVQALPALGATLSEQYGQPWHVTLRLPPASIGVTHRVWAFNDHRVAAEALKECVRRYPPAFARILPVVDAHVLTQTKSWRGSPRYRHYGSAALHVAFVGGRLTRHAALAEASWMIERKGGVSHYRTAPPPDVLLDTIAVACGAGRLVLPSDPSPLLPDNSVEKDRMTFNGRSLKSETVVWYARDLTDSLGEAARLYRLPPATSAAPTSTISASPVERQNGSNHY